MSHAPHNISYSNISLYPTEHAIYVFFQTVFFKVYLASGHIHVQFTRFKPSIFISTLLNVVEDDDSECVVVGDGDYDDNDDSGGG